MTAEQKARQLALTLVGEDQSPEPLIEVLMEMAEWQRKQMMEEAIPGEWWRCGIAIPSQYMNTEDIKYVKVIIIKED